MVVDSSALVALVRKEPDAGAFLELIYGATRPCISAANLLETLIVLAGRTGNDNWPKVERLVHEARLETVPVTLEQVRLANAAFLRYGKGRHKAALNFGDCFAYALAKALDLPLLFKGDDFARTDVRPAR